MSNPRTLATLAALPLLALTACGGNYPADDTAPITHTVTATPKPAVKTVVPQSCLNAITAAEGTASIQVEVLDSASTLPGLIIDAYRAGLMGGNLDVVTRKLDASTTIITAANRRLDPQVSRFNAAKFACQARAGR